MGFFVKNDEFGSRFHGINDGTLAEDHTALRQYGNEESNGPGNL